MLKVIGCIEINESRLVMDGYVPMSFRCWEVRSDVSVPTYWRVGNLKTSLIEIGISQENGAIFGVTVVALAHVRDLRLRPGYRLNPTAPRKLGLPLCDIEKSGELKYMDESMNLIVDYDDESIYIRFGDKAAESKMYQAGRLIFGVDSRDEICSLWIDGLRKGELDNFLSATSPV